MDHEGKPFREVSEPGRLIDGGPLHVNLDDFKQERPSWEI